MSSWICDKSLVATEARVIAPERANLHAPAGWIRRLARRKNGSVRTASEVSSGNFAFWKTRTHGACHSSLPLSSATMKPVSTRAAGRITLDQAFAYEPTDILGKVRVAARKASNGGESGCPNALLFAVFMGARASFGI